MLVDEEIPPQGIIPPFVLQTREACTNDLEASTSGSLENHDDPTAMENPRHLEILGIPVQFTVPQVSTNESQLLQSVMTDSCPPGPPARPTDDLVAQPQRQQPVRDVLTPTLPVPEIDHFEDAASHLPTRSSSPEPEHRSPATTGLPETPSTAPDNSHLDGTAEVVAAPTAASASEVPPQQSTCSPSASLRDIRAAARKQVSSPP